MPPRGPHAPAIAADQRAERDFIRAALLQGQAALAALDLSHADDRLHHALTRARAVNVVELELPGRLKRFKTSAFYFIHGFEGFEWEFLRRQRRAAEAEPLFASARARRRR
jgi:hypothetical protein